MTSEAACCGVRGCDATFEVRSAHGQIILDDKGRAFFPICSQHYRWLRGACPVSAIDDGALIPGSLAIRAGPRRSTWLHDHCLPALRIDGGAVEGVGERRAAERWPAP